MLTEIGRVLRKMSWAAMRTMKQKLRKSHKWGEEDRFTLEDVCTAYESFRSHMRRGDSWKAVRRIDDYFRHLFEFYPDDKTKCKTDNVPNHEKRRPDWINRVSTYVESLDNGSYGLCGEAQARAPTGATTAWRASRLWTARKQWFSRPRIPAQLSSQAIALIQKGKKTIDQVPAELRAEVEAILAGLEAEA